MKTYTKFFIFLIPPLIFMINAEAKVQQVLLKDQWKYSSSADDLIISTSKNQDQIVNVKNKLYDVLFIASDAPPQSIKSIKSRISELKGNLKTLHTIPRGKGAVFIFQSGENMHWYSTNGGHLLMMSKKLPSKSLKLLTKRIEWVGR